MHATVGVNTSVEQNDAAERVRRQNTKDYILGNFFHLLDESVLHVHKFLSGDQLSLYLPKGPYAERSLGIMALSGAKLREAENRPDQTVETHFVYDLDHQTQLQYWNYVLRGLSAMDIVRSRMDHPGELNPIYTENSACTVTNNQYRVGRTISAPHGQIILSDSTHVDSLTAEEEISFLRPLEEERVEWMQSELVDLALHNLHKKITKATHTSFDFDLVKTRAPAGYEIQLTGAIGPECMTDFMRLHHAAYKRGAQVVHRILSSELPYEVFHRLKPQPSYSLYITKLDDRKGFSITVSPALYGPWGVLEKTGQLLNRGTNNPLRSESLHRLEFAQELIETIHAIGVNNRELVSV